MEIVNKLIQQAKLQKAIEYIISQLQQKPTDLELRSCFVELMCIDGQLERADKQLNLLIKQHPDCLIGASNLRLLIRAAQARIDFSDGAATATLVKDVDESFESLVRMRLARQDDDKELLQENARLLESTRNDTAMNIDNEQRELVRDLDDTLCGYLELFGTNGKYYLIPFDALISLKLKPVASLVELIWRKVEIDIEGGLSGEAFIPMTYLGSDTDARKLGRETDWMAIDETEVYVGVGQKMILFGDEAKALSQIVSLQPVKEQA